MAKDESHGDLPYAAGEAAGIAPCYLLDFGDAAQRAEIEGFIDLENDNPVRPVDAPFQLAQPVIRVEKRRKPTSRTSKRRNHRSLPA